MKNTISTLFDRIEQNGAELTRLRQEVRELRRENEEVRRHRDGLLNRVQCDIVRKLPPDQQEEFAKAWGVNLSEDEGATV